jgi:hypothetical protein
MEQHFAAYRLAIDEHGLADKVSRFRHSRYEACYTHY